MVGIWRRVYGILRIEEIYLPWVGIWFLRMDPICYHIISWGDMILLDRLDLQFRGLLSFHPSSFSVSFPMSRDPVHEQCK